MNVSKNLMNAVHGLKQVYLASIFSLIGFPCFAQSEGIKFGLEEHSIVTTKGNVPFWMRSNQYGSIPNSGASFSLIGNFRKEYQSNTYDSTRGKIDWGAGFESRINIGDRKEFILTEAYLKAKAGPFEMSAGRSKDIMGLVDSTLSSGSFAVSGNALAIPKIEISFPEFLILPYAGQLISIKGNLAHGWFGTIPIQFANVENAKSYFHQKSFYVRLGKPMSKIKLYGGFNQEVTWGDEKKIFERENYSKSVAETFFYVFTGKNYVKSGKNTISHVGNQLGTIDIAAEYRFDDLILKAYRQNIYDKGALYYLENIMDGLNGVSISNTKKTGEAPFAWKKVLFELLYTKNQAGESWSGETPSGPELYYNHGIYSDGYSYRGQGIGTPFISSKKSVRAGFASHPMEFFINNRVFLIHAGLEGRVFNLQHLLKLSYSSNYGSYFTSDKKLFWYDGKQVPHVPKYGVFTPVKQFSMFVEGSKKFNNGMCIGYAAAFDRGGLLYNSEGLILKVSKSFNYRYKRRHTDTIL